MEQSIKWYDYAYSVSSEYRKEPEDSRYYPIWNMAVSLIGKEKVIDLGCGSGQFAKLLLKNEKSFVCGIDFSDEAITMARRLNPAGKFILNDLLADVPIPEYDIAVCFEVLEHIVRDLDLIKKIGSGKRFIFSVPNYDYHSHVRKFDSKTDIIKRYSDFVDIKHICQFFISNDHIIYLVDSVKT